MTTFILGLNHSLISYQIPFMSHAIPSDIIFHTTQKTSLKTPFFYFAFLSR